MDDVDSPEIFVKLTEAGVSVDLKDITVKISDLIDSTLWHYFEHRNAEETDKDEVMLATKRPS